MCWIDDQGRLFGKVNIVDTIVVVGLLLAVLGLVLVKTKGHITSGQVAQGESDVAIDVQITNLKTLDSNLFKPGEKTAITIRNQPRGEVTIDSVKTEPYQMTLPGGGRHPILVPDSTEPNSINVYLRLNDHATQTPDGFVSEGVKIKVGLPIELEGFKYRVTGKIVDVKAVKSDAKAS